MLAAIAGGTVAGLAAVLAVVVAQAHLWQRYVESVADLVGWPLVPGVLVLVAVLAVELSPRCRSRWVAIGGSVAMFAGIGLGILVGAMFIPAPEGRWAGGIVGAGLGVVAGGATGAVHGCRRRGDEEEDR